MILTLSFCCLNTHTRSFFTRSVVLDTKSLDATTRAAVEYCYEIGESDNRRGLLRYRQLFDEKGHLGGSVLPGALKQGESFGSFHISNYFEDENGKELTLRDVGVCLSGNPAAILVPCGTTQHEIKYMLADKHPIAIDSVSLSECELSALGYFARDLREVLTSAFYRCGPGTLEGFGANELMLKTAASDEEIRSFVTIFRRLYMDGEPANFMRAVQVFCDAVKGNAIADWVKGEAERYNEELKGNVDFMHLAGCEKWAFPCKRLIDVFFYTQYAHQPDSRRVRQYQECLASVGGSKEVLAWLFLSTLWRFALHMGNAGSLVADFYDRYCDFRQILPPVLPSLCKDHSGIGALEKPEARQKRVRHEKAEKLAAEIWQERGRPEGGSAKFLPLAFQRLDQASGNSAGI